MCLTRVAHLYASAEEVFNTAHDYGRVIYGIFERSGLPQNQALYVWPTYLCSQELHRHLPGQTLSLLETCTVGGKWNNLHSTGRTHTEKRPWPLDNSEDAQSTQRYYE